MKKAMKLKIQKMAKKFMENKMSKGTAFFDILQKSK